MPIENTQEFRSVGTGKVSFWAQFTDSLHAGLQSGQSGRTRPSNGAVIFYDAGFSAKLRGFRLVTSL